MKVKLKQWHIVANHMDHLLNKQLWDRVGVNLTFNLSPVLHGQAVSRIFERMSDSVSETGGNDVF